MVLRPLHVALVLLGGLLAVIPSQLASPAGSPAYFETAEFLRLVLGLPAVLLLPGLPLAPLLMRQDVARDGALSTPWTCIAALGLTLCAHAVNFNLLRAVGVPIEWPALIGLVSLETLAFSVLLHRRAPDLRFRRPSSGLLAGAAVLVLGLLGAFVRWGTEVTVDSSWNYHSPVLEAGLDGPTEPTDLSFGIPGDASWPMGEPRPVLAEATVLRLTNTAATEQRVPVMVLVHGPLGTSGSLVSDGEERAGATVEQLVTPEGTDFPVERHWDWGNVALVAAIPSAPQGATDVEIRVQVPEGRALSEAAISWFVGGSGRDIRLAARGRGFRSMHPFQMLNVTENVRWADEVATDQVLSGRSPDGSSALHQPPAWTYLYAPARQMLTPHLASASALLLAILIGIGGLGLAAAEDTSPERRLGGPEGAALGVALAATALQHGRLMVSDGSMNFPDSLYALGLVAAVALLVTGRTRTFLLWGFLAAVLRYPGAVVVLLAALALAGLRADLRRRVVDAVMRFGLGIAAFCGGMLLIAVLSGSLEQWLFALWFETVPEHFDNNPDALPLWRRPLEFGRIWLLVGGGAVVASLPFRGTLCRVALATALLYAPFLAFIDHFSHHYFLPLIGLVGLGVAANAAAAPTEKARTIDALAFAAVAVGLYLWGGVTG